jgi:hypothetical protein
MENLANLGFEMFDELLESHLFPILSNGLDLKPRRKVLYLLYPYVRYHGHVGIGTSSGSGSSNFKLFYPDTKSEALNAAFCM